MRTTKSIETLLLERYEELQRKLRQTKCEHEFDMVYSARQEIGDMLVKSGTIDKEELRTYLESINIKINLEYQGH